MKMGIKTTSRDNSQKIERAFSKAGPESKSNYFVVTEAYRDHPCYFKALDVIECMEYLLQIVEDSGQSIESRSESIRLLMDGAAAYAMLGILIQSENNPTPEKTKGPELWLLNAEKFIESKIQKQSERAQGADFESAFTIYRAALLGPIHQFPRSNPDESMLIRSAAASALLAIYARTVDDIESANRAKKVGLQHLEAYKNPMYAEVDARKLFETSCRTDNKRSLDATLAKYFDLAVEALYPDARRRGISLFPEAVTDALSIEQSIDDLEIRATKGRTLEFEIKLGVFLQNAATLQSADLMKVCFGKSGLFHVANKIKHCLEEDKELFEEAIRYANTIAVNQKEITKKWGNLS